MDMQDNLDIEEGRKTTREMVARCALRYQDSDKLRTKKEEGLKRKLSEPRYIVTRKMPSTRI